MKPGLAPASSKLTGGKVLWVHPVSFEKHRGAADQCLRGPEQDRSGFGGGSLSVEGGRKSLEHVRELGYLVAPFIGLKEFWDDLKDKREDRLPKKVMRALMGQRADSDGKPVWKGRTDYPSDVQRLTVAVLQGEFGFTLKGARDLRLAECYKTGAGVPEDATKALKWYTKAADRGHAEAQYELAEHYWYGSGDAPYRPAEQGNPGAQFSLGVSYASGMGVGQDDAKAVECFRLETEQEHALARYFLANWL
eukprot:g17454.t1